MNHLLIESSFISLSIGCNRILYKDLDSDSCFGMADITGKVLTPPCFNISFDDNDLFHDGLILLCFKDKWGFLNTNGEITIPFVFSKAKSFKNGKANVIYDDRLVLEIDTKGNIISSRPIKEDEHFSRALARPAKFECVDEESQMRYVKLANSIDNLRIISSLRDGWVLCGFFINNRIVPDKYIYYDKGFTRNSRFFDSAEPFYGGYAVADGQLINTQLQPILSGFDSSHVLGSCFLSASYNGKWGVVDYDGNVIINFRYDDPVEQTSSLDRFTQHLVDEMKLYNHEQGKERFSDYLSALKDTAQLFEDTINSKPRRKEKAKDNNLSESGNSNIKWSTVFLLCLFFGLFGVHHFYVKNNGKGLLFLLTLGICSIGWLVDLLKLLSGTFTDSEGKEVVRQ